ncbi:MAG: STN domain-containing protein, partial [Bacteroidales bacterium]|nr:STN domain-containing protein [Bacteroidales bacterium]
MSRNQPLRIFVLILALLLLATSLQAQVTLSVKERPLREVISLVEKESGYSFFFSSTLPGLDRKISLNVSGKSVSQTVEEMLKGFDITYSI